MALVTCKHCKNKINKTNAFTNKPRVYYCSEDCYNKTMVKYSRKKCRICGGKFEDSLLELQLDKYNVCTTCLPVFQNDKSYDCERFLYYIYNNLSNKQCNYMAIRQQAQHYFKELNFSYKGMLLTAEYWYEVLGNTWRGEYGLGQIFPKCYEEAKQHFATINRIKLAVDEIDGLTLKPLVAKYKEKKIKTIDIDSI